MPLRTSSIHGVSIPCLVPLTTSGTRPPIILADSSIVIGSGDAAQIRLKSLSVSKAHALVLVDDGKAYVRDLASRTELFVNDVAVRDAVLNHGDVVRVGKFGFGITEDAALAQVQRPRLAAAPTVLLRVGDEAELRRVSEPVVLIGRRARCDITLADDSLSGAHAVMFRIGRRWFLRDLSSRTGTVVNGALIRQQRGLEDGDLIRVGRVDIRFMGEERISGYTGGSGAGSEPSFVREPAPRAEAALPTATPQVTDPVASKAGVAVAEVESAPAATAETSHEADPNGLAGSWTPHDIFGMGDNASSSPASPARPVPANENPLLDPPSPDAGVEGPIRDLAGATDVESRSEGESGLVDDGVRTSQVGWAPRSPAAFSGPMTVTYHPMHDGDTEAASPTSVDGEGRPAGAEATDEEWEQSVAVWSFEDLARRASRDDAGEGQAAEEGRGLLWAAVAVGVTCLGVIAWLVVFKLL